jgi:hypothetical protein
MVLSSVQQRGHRQSRRPRLLSFDAGTSGSVTGSLTLPPPSARRRQEWTFDGTTLSHCGQVVAHAAHDHGITEVTPELAAKVKAAIQTR